MWYTKWVGHIFMSMSSGLIPCNVVVRCQHCFLHFQGEVTDAGNKGKIYRTGVQEGKWEGVWQPILLMLGGGGGGGGLIQPIVTGNKVTLGNLDF
jgi:hypothetical protein